MTTKFYKRNNNSLAKSLIYPDIKTIKLHEKYYNDENMILLKSLQLKNNQKKLEELNKKPEIPFKMKEYRNISSKLPQILNKNYKTTTKTYKTEEDKNNSNSNNNEFQEYKDYKDYLEHRDKKDNRKVSFKENNSERINITNKELRSKILHQHGNGNSNSSGTGTGILKPKLMTNVFPKSIDEKGGNYEYNVNQHKNQRGERHNDKHNDKHVDNELLKKYEQDLELKQALEQERKDKEKDTENIYNLVNSYSIENLQNLYSSNPSNPNNMNVEEKLLNNIKKSKSKVKDKKKEKDRDTEREMNKIEIKPDYNNIRYIRLKDETPAANDTLELAEHEQIDHVIENKLKVIKGEIPLVKHKIIREKSAIHKNYGKVPKYIDNYKSEHEAMVEKRKFEKQYEAELKLGMRKISEEERINTLNELMVARTELLNQYEKLPITMRGLHAIKKKQEIESNLEIIENSIGQFNKKTVFIKIR